MLPEGGVWPPMPQVLPKSRTHPRTQHAHRVVDAFTGGFGTLRCPDRGGQASDGDGNQLHGYMIHLSHIQTEWNPLYYNHAHPFWVDNYMDCLNYRLENIPKREIKIPQQDQTLRRTHRNRKPLFNKHLWDVQNVHNMGFRDHQLH